MKNHKSFIGKLIVFSSFVYAFYAALKQHGYWEDLKTKLKEEKEKWKEKYNQNTVNSEWYTVDSQEILRQRFASGEIDEEEYRNKLNILNSK